MEIQKFYRFLSLYIWGGFPSFLQRKLSSTYAKIYNAPISRHLIGPYSRIHYPDPIYLSRFKPASGSDSYQTFQDFFVRKLKNHPELEGDITWPCEGILCEYDQVGNLPEVNVKKQKRSLRTIFGDGGPGIPDSYYFSNVFLHNRDYHRIHAPVSGQITRIEHIPGDLVLLRPWIYPEDPSHPALRNERYNVDITDPEGKTWFLSIVGGPAVGTILLNENSYIKSDVSAGDEIATFLLGSTCCMATPVPTTKRVGETVQIGEVLG